MLHYSSAKLKEGIWRSEDRANKVICTDFKSDLNELRRLFGYSKRNDSSL